MKDLVEKIQIFDDGLDDRWIEIYKVYFLHTRKDREFDALYTGAILSNKEYKKVIIVTDKNENRDSYEFHEDLYEHLKKYIDQKEVDRLSNKTHATFSIDRDWATYNYIIPFKKIDHSLGRSNLNFDMLEELCKARNMPEHWFNTMVNIAYKNKYVLDSVVIPEIKLTNEIVDKWLDEPKKHLQELYSYFYYDNSDKHALAILEEYKKIHNGIKSSKPTFYVDERAFSTTVFRLINENLDVYNYAIDDFVPAPKVMFMDAYGEMKIKLVSVEERDEIIKRGKEIYNKWLLNIKFVENNEYWVEEFLNDRTSLDLSKMLYWLKRSPIYFKVNEKDESPCVELQPFQDESSLVYEGFLAYTSEKKVPNIKGYNKLVKGNIFDFIKAIEKRYKDALKFNPLVSIYINPSKLSYRTLDLDFETFKSLEKIKIEINDMFS